jgi:hypothetical protein
VSHDTDAIVDLKGSEEEEVLSESRKADTTVHTVVLEES